MAIQNDNTILNKGDLKAYHERIAPMLGGTFMVGTNVSDHYSTDEKVVGVWTNGKPIYQKTWTGIDISGMIDGVNHNIIDITSLHADTTVKVEAISHQLTSGQKYDYPNTFFNPASTSTGEPLKVNVWRRSENYIGFNATNLDITSVDVTFCYTKTTDAAGSATTTPGAYDINFPNTWPANKEIFFGNGMYGYRATGNVVTTGNTLPISGVKKFYGYGGSSDNGAGANVHTFPYTNPAALPTWGNCLWADHNNGIPHIYWGTGYTTNTTFDIWFKYTK